MNRRKYLAAIAVCVSSAGCLNRIDAATASEPDSDGEAGNEPLTVTAPTVERGETTTMTVDADSVSTLRFSDIPNPGPVTYSDARFSPSPSSVYQRDPPTWVWSDSPDVSGEIPVRASADVPPGNYQYTIALQQEASEEARTETVVIEVTNGK